MVRVILPSGPGQRVVPLFVPSGKSVGVAEGLLDSLADVECDLVAPVTFRPAVDCGATAADVSCHLQGEFDLAQLSGEVDAPIYVSVRTNL